MVVHAIVDPAIVAAGVPTALADDEHSRALPAAAVTTGPIAGHQGSQQAVPEVRLRCLIRLGHRFDDLRTGQDVSLDRHAVPGPPTSPRLAIAAGESGGAAAGVDETRLALLALRIGVQQGTQCRLGRFAGRHASQTIGPIGRVGVGLRGDGAGSGGGPGHDGTHRRELRRDRNSPGRQGRVPGHDGKGGDGLAGDAQGEVSSYQAAWN
jgi:hypothetical protein